MGVCHGPEFVTVGGILMPAAAGAYRMVVKLRKDSVNDGPFGSTPTPGRTHIDAETSWVNNTGVPQFVQVEAERGPWAIIQATPNQAYFKDNLTAAVGVNARAADPAPVNGSTSYYYHATDSANTFWAQDRSRWMYGTLPVCQPGETVSARYQVALETFGRWLTPNGDKALYEAYARYAILRIFAAPART